MDKTRLARFSRSDWLELFRGWRDGEAKRIASETDAKILAQYMPYIIDSILSGEGFFWFPPAMTPEQCVQQQMRQYDSFAAVSSGWTNLSLEHIVSS